MEVDYDLSKVLFIATANSLDTVQGPLRDRMEIIEISGYTVEEKIEIARKHLVPKQLEQHGIKPKDLKVDDKAIQKVIEGYTRESGVRRLEQQIGALIRKVAKSIAMSEEYPKTVKAEHVEKMLGGVIFDRDLYEGNDVPGGCNRLGLDFGWWRYSFYRIKPKSWKRTNHTFWTVGRCNERICNNGSFLPKISC